MNGIRPPIWNFFPMKNASFQQKTYLFMPACTMRSCSFRAEAETNLRPQSHVHSYGFSPSIIVKSNIALRSAFPFKQTNLRHTKPKCTQAAHIIFSHYIPYQSTNNQSQQSNKPSISNFSSKFRSTKVPLQELESFQ